MPNPGVFRFHDKIWLLVRVAERPQQTKVHISFPVLNPDGSTTLSHLRLLCSEDSIHFSEPKGYPYLFGTGPLQTFGIDHCRVTFLDQMYYLTFTAVSENGVGVGLRTTNDWVNFQHKGMILPPHNKDYAIFEEKINGMYYALHRSSSVDLGGNYIWLAKSPDAIHWGNHKCLIKTRQGSWDSTRVDI